MTNKTTTIRVRVTPAEQSVAQSKADACGLSLSAYIRSAIGGRLQEHRIAQATSELVDLYAWLLKEDQTESARRVLAVTYRLKGDSQ